MAHPKDVLKNLGASPLKALSQNFLTSPHWAEKLVEAFLQVGAFDEVWEIGPGLGALSEVLLKKTKKPVKLFELDKKLAAYLTNLFPHTPLFQGDFLEQNWASLHSSDGKIAILSNLPYHLSSAMIFKMVEHKEKLSHFPFTFQKEFAERLTSPPGTKDFGALTLITEIHFNVSPLGTLPPGAFYPPPSVSSQALLFIPKKNHPEEQKLTALIKAGFKHRRKKMAGNLKEAYPDYPWESFVQNLGLSPGVRAETLNLIQFENLLNEMNNYIK